MLSLVFFLKKVGHSRPLFLFIFVFSIQLIVNKFNINFANDWIRTTVVSNRSTNWATTTSLLNSV